MQTNSPLSQIELSDAQIKTFQQDGFIIVRGLADPSTCSRMRDAIETFLNPPLGPVEFEVDIKYPGAPDSPDSPGGKTPRRLLNAYSRDPVFRDWAGNESVLRIIGQLLDSKEIMLTQNHHNCIMTKMPGYSSMTGWHQDIRYWSFDRPELVNAWLALGDEYAEKGAMQFIPGSSSIDLDLDRGRFDAELFLRDDLTANQELIMQAVKAELSAGDVIFFHCRTMHCASANSTDHPKYSVVFSYHTAGNQPIPGTRSSRLASIKLS